jgi:class 3 adenylate cyclase/CheY-like chemotaxis protein
MTKRILLLQSDPEAAQTLADYFSKKGDKVWQTTDVSKVLGFLDRIRPDIVFVDLHLQGYDWLDLLSRLQHEYPKTGVIVTNKHPDLRRELLVKDRGISVFLRQPFTANWIERALKKLDDSAPPAAKFSSPKEKLPRVRLPMRAKITFPYALLALLFALGATYLVSRYILESLQDRFTNQLVDVGKLSSDWMVQEENRLLESLRLIANTQGVADAIVDRDADQLREIALPIAINYQEEAIVVLDLRGKSLLSMYHQVGGAPDAYDVTQGDDSLAKYNFVQNVLNGKTDQSGNKFAGLVKEKLADYLFISGPVYDLNGNRVGAILVGKSLTSLSQQIRQDTLAQISFYNPDGNLIASTLLMQQDVKPLPSGTVAEVFQRQDRESNIRDLKVASASYSELLGPWEVRGGQDLGIIGVSLAQNYFARPTLVTRLQLYGFVAVGFLVVIAMGLILANQITKPLSQVVQASVEVARGNLEVKVPSKGNDEVMVLAHAFNYMVSGLQEGFIYRDLLGRTVSPEVREALRYSFASGNLRLEGQSTVGTVLMSDIRSFTALSEQEEPTTVLNWLNEYFGEMVPVITSHGGVVDKFEGDAMLSFFGILPTPLPSHESAYQACQAAVELLAVIDSINTRRASRGEPVLITGIGINTGSLTAGGLGTVDRLNYTIIGDTVNTCERIQDITREFGESGVAVSENTLAALQGHRGEFRFEALGERGFKGKMELLWIYRLWPALNGQGKRGSS